MRILVLGATGYVGSRLIPALLTAGHQVTAAASSPPDPDRFAWGEKVDWVRCDATDAAQVAEAVSGVEAVCYLVHSLSLRAFSERDRRAAWAVREAVDAAPSVRRLVYLTGLIPEMDGAPLADADLSAHLASRLEVERILLGVGCSSVALRAGVVIGAGSTSYEVIRQLATLFLIHPVPDDLRSRIQPISVSDTVTALVDCLGSDRWTGPVDLGGPEVVTYRELLAAYCRTAGLVRVPITVPVPIAGVASGVTALAVAASVAVPFWTVVALVQSLRHDMVCGTAPTTWRPPRGRPTLGLEEALARAEAGSPEHMESALASDPAWARMRAPVLDELGAPASVRAGVSLGLRRLRDWW